MNHPIKRAPLMSYVPTGLARRVKARAKRERRSVSAVIELALNQYLEKDHAKPSTTG